jgi:hypothetical protein
VRPSPLVPLVLTGVAGAGWLTAIGLGFAALRPWWVLLALLAGLGGLALALRGAPFVGLMPVVVGAVAWGFALASHAPASALDVPGGLGLVGWNLAYAVPLLVAYGLAVWTDARRLGWARVRAGAGERRWWGVEGAEQERHLGLLEAVPAARFAALGDGSWLVVAGRRVALVRAVVWPGGAYAVDGGGEVLRDGRRYVHGCDELAELAAGLRDWSSLLRETGAECRGFAVVYPGRPGDDVSVRAAGGRPVRVIPAGELVEAVGGQLAEEAYRLDVPVLLALDARLGLFG